jgi:NAD(P)-dependent dehydrogenase (short-subunit alcohol dehydrogenase family)
MASSKRALVSGSAVRVGRAIAVALARDGWFVHVHARRDAEAAQATLDLVRQAGGQGDVVVGDIASRAGCESVFAQIGEESLDLLVNNVGVYSTGPLSTFAPAEWDRLLRTNLDGTFHCCQLAIPRLRRGGSIVNLGYVGVQNLAGTVKTAAYSVTKAGILVLTRSLALELAPRGIRVNMVSPGQLDNSVDLPEDHACRIPLGRPGTSGDVAQAVLWLASENASYVTGQNLDVAGGLMLGLRGDL